MPDNPFTDPHAVHGDLYATPARLARRSDTLYRAKVQGPNAAESLADLVKATGPCARTVVDIGGGTGRLAHSLARRLKPRFLLVLDQSVGLLGEAHQRLHAIELPTSCTCGDFHRLPLRPNTVDVVVAAFCLYHSTRPQDVVEEIAGCLSPAGRAIVATKSIDSYQELDELVCRSGLDPLAQERPSLYGSFHSENAPGIVDAAMDVERVRHEQHVFRFDDLMQVAAYLATSPKYRLPDSLTANPARLAEELRRRQRDRVLTMTSTVTYIAASPR